MTALALFLIWLIGGSIIMFAMFYAGSERGGPQPLGDESYGDVPAIPTIDNPFHDHRNTKPGA